MTVKTRRHDITPPDLDDPAAVLAVVREATCPFCLRAPWQQIARHTEAAHDVTSERLHELCGVGYSESLVPPEFAEHLAMMQRERLKRPGELERLQSAASAPRLATRRLTPLDLERACRQLEAARSPEQRARATAAGHTPEASAKRSASVRRAWETSPRQWKCSVCGGKKLSGVSKGAKTCGPACSTIRRSAAGKAAAERLAARRKVTS